MSHFFGVVALITFSAYVVGIKHGHELFPLVKEFRIEVRCLEVIGSVIRRSEIKGSVP